MRFDPADGSTPTQSTVKTGTLATPPQQNPQRQGFRFDGWAYDGQPFDFRTPILQDTTLKAQWTKVTDWKLSPNHGPASGARLTINPPDRQGPCYVSVQAAGNQFVSLTGDGRIYTWTQDSTPKQIPFPAQAPDGFHYLQAATGSRWQAALGSDQHIYTWTSGQSTPTILDTGRKTQFTTISMNDDRLLAVDLQGQAHTFQNSQADSQNLSLKPAEQATLNLPGQAQAVLAVASASRALMVDADGQAWTWDESNTGKTRPADLKQDPGTRIVQIQALNQGYLLLDADGQARYLANNTTAIAAVSLPDGEHIGRINGSDERAIIIDKNGHVWTWKIGETPARTDKGSQLYMQAASTGSRITGISKQGDIYRWNLDPQNKPDKPAKVDTIAAPTLVSASMDGQALTLSRNNGSWQVDIPDRKPGPAAILITGRQDGQPFTRSLNYTVDQTLTRDAAPRSTLTVRFDTDGGKPEPADQSVSTPNSRVKRPSPDPAREGFLFDGWFTGEVAYDFSKPVTKDLTLTAHWSPAGRNSTWSISPDKGSQLGRESTTITPPDSASRGIRFNQVSGGKNYNSNYGFSLAVGSDGNAYAWGDNTYGKLGDGTRTQRTTPVKVSKPTNTPTDFTYVQVSAGWNHSLALGSNGYVYAWGNNDSGRLGDGTTTDRNMPVKVEKPADAPTNFTYVQVSAGANHSLALGSDGYAYAWGNNSNGQLGDGTTTDRNMPVKVEKPADAPTNFTYVQVSAGYWHSLALGSDGNAYAWGHNDSGELGDGTTTRRTRTTPVRVKTPDRKSYPDLPEDFTFTQVSAGNGYSLAVGRDGYAYAWGSNIDGALGNNTTSFSANPVPVRVHDPASPEDASKGLQATQVSGGTNFPLAVGRNGYAYAWGWNSNGQLGNNTTSNSWIPVRVRDPASPRDASKGLQATQVSGGGYHSLAVGSDGNAYAWGYNGYGQLGNDSIPTGSSYQAQSSVPVPVSFNLQLVITGVRFDQTPVSGLTRGDGSSVSVLTPAHQPGTVTVSVDYTLGGAPQTPDTTLKYTYLPAGVLPQAGGEGILLALATGVTGMGGVLASRRHRREQHQLSHASLE